ncbi:MAG: formylglycine-generating enzyme family protein [Candidatus Symbiothrix sp.]|nr:formylglycine-generating enzyme family protein [Candidatus Symbiothrix sp.]
MAWYYYNGDGKTHPVGTKQANELGIYDMSGNVSEWCSDWYGSYSSGSQTNPRGASTGSKRVLRGGSWGSLAMYGARFVRVSRRDDNLPVSRFVSVGLRLALSSKQEQREEEETAQTQKKTAEEYESADNSKNSWLIGTWEVNLPEFGLYKLVITDSKNCYTIDSYGRKAGTYEIDGDLMVVYNDSYGTDYPLDRANKRISAGYGHYFKKVK